MARSDRLVPTRTDATIATALVLLAEVEVWRYGVAGGGPAAALAVGLGGALVAWRTRLPLAAAAGALVATWLATRAGGEAVSVTLFAALVILFFTVGALADRRRAVIGLLLGLVAGVPLTVDGSVNTYLAAVCTSFVVPWLLGSLKLRLHDARVLERERALTAERAVAEERARLARELHDVASHNIGVIVVQAEAGDVLLDEHPERARDALRAIERAGREALVELRHMLGLMREDDPAAVEPAARLSAVGELVGRVRAAGLPVELRVEGRGAVELGPSVELAAYRVVQEALTNILKHAGPCAACVTLRYGPEALEVEVSDDGPGTTPSGEHGGHGLAGLRERVSIAGGELWTGEPAGGGFVVRARLPTAGVSA